MARYWLHHLVIPRSTPRPPAPSPLAELALNLYTKIWFVRPQAKLTQSRQRGRQSHVNVTAHSVGRNLPEGNFAAANRCGLFAHPTVETLGAKSRGALSVDSVVGASTRHR